MRTTATPPAGTEGLLPQRLAAAVAAVLQLAAEEAEGAPAEPELVAAAAAACRWRRQQSGRA